MDWECAFFYNLGNYIPGRCMVLELVLKKMVEIFCMSPVLRPEFDPNLQVGEGMPPDLLKGWGPLNNSLEGIIMDVHLHCSGSNSF